MQAQKWHSAALRKINSFWYLTQGEMQLFLSLCDKLQSTTKTFSLCHAHTHIRIYTNTARQGTEHPSKHPISLTQTHRTALGFVLLYEILSKHLSLFSLLHPLSRFFIYFFILVWMWSQLCAVLLGFIALIGLAGTVESWKSYSCPGL